MRAEQQVVAGRLPAGPERRPHSTSRDPAEASESATLRVRSRYSGVSAAPPPRITAAARWARIISMNSSSRRTSPSVLHTRLRCPRRAASRSTPYAMCANDGPVMSSSTKASVGVPAPATALARASAT
ncbi:hypothetical protein [Streptomyces sp. 900105755]